MSAVTAQYARKLHQMSEDINSVNCCTKLALFYCAGVFGRVLEIFWDHLDFQISAKKKPFSPEKNGINSENETTSGLCFLPAYKVLLKRKLTFLAKHSVPVG